MCWVILEVLFLLQSGESGSFQNLAFLTLQAKLTGSELPNQQPT